MQERLPGSFDKMHRTMQELLRDSTVHGQSSTFLSRKDLDEMFYMAFVTFSCVDSI